MAAILWPTYRSYFFGFLYVFCQVFYFRYVIIFVSYFSISNRTEKNMKIGPWSKIHGPWIFELRFYSILKFIYRGIFYSKTNIS
mgnify:CR=1 FL=1